MRWRIRGSGWSRATCSTRGRARRGRRGLRLGLSPAGERRRAPRSRSPPPRSRAEHGRDRPTCSRRCAPEGVKRIAFSSTGSVYGEPDVFPTPEDAPFPLQTSLYAASKLAGEGLIEAYAAGFGFTGLICRFVSILGERYTHGHVFDFYRALKRDPTRLRVLGDGRQEKSYLYVQDCIAAILAAAERHARSPAPTLQSRHRRDAARRRVRRDDHRAPLGSPRRSSTPAGAAAGSATAR